LPSAAERYIEEVKRVLGVLEGQLSKPENKGWLAAGKYTIADLTFISWMHLVERLPGVSLSSDFPTVGKWLQTMLDRPGTIKGYVGGPYEKKERERIDRE